MRIIAGQFRGTRLAEVGKGDAAAHLRPTSDRVRENIFNLLMGGSYGNPIAGARVLDLYAGTGAMGLEAVSRGAASATFVDNGAKALALLRQNIRICGVEKATTVLRRDAARLGDWPDVGFDLVFIDPPYGKGLATKTLAMALAGGWLTSKALVICEENQQLPAPLGFAQMDNRRYGGTYISVLRPVVEQ